MQENLEEKITKGNSTLIITKKENTYFIEIRTPKMWLYEPKPKATLKEIKNYFERLTKNNLNYKK